jgi:hypothetical protein
VVIGRVDREVITGKEWEGFQGIWNNQRKSGGPGTGVGVGLGLRGKCTDVTAIILRHRETPSK